MKTQPVPETLKRINMRRFLDILRDGKAVSRADLTRVTRVSAATSSKIIAELLESGLIEEIPETRSTQGRPGRLFRLSRTSAYLVGIEIGSHGLRIGRSGLDGELLEEPVFHECKVDAATLATQIDQAMRRFGTGCFGLGLSAPGLVRSAQGVIEYSPLVGVNNPLPLAAQLGHTLRLRVTLVQENHGLAMAEQYFGAARGSENFLLVDVGDGVGMSVVDQSRILLGRDGFTAELGHMVVEPGGARCSCGNNGCLQTVANHAALVGNPGAGIAALGRALGAAANLYNPGAIFISGDFFLDPARLEELRKAFKENTLAPILTGISVSHTLTTKVQGAIAAIQERIFSEVGPRLV